VLTDTPHLFSRRDFVRAGAAAVAGAIAPRLEAAQTERFRFVVITDLHYRDARCGEWLTRVAAQLRASRPRPAFVVLAGDLSDLGTAGELGAVREIFRSLPMPVYSQAGNHDYTLDGRRGPYELHFGRRMNRRIDYGGYQFLLLDSAEGRGVFRTDIPRETLSWLDEARASLSREKPLVVITHFPLGTNWLRPRNADALLYRVRDFPLQAGFSGHWHGLSERRENGVQLSIGRCCSWWRTNHDGSDLKGYTLCRAIDGRVEHEFVSVPTLGLRS
jgi:3',5'-cyclic AMP phosphodiesterase CpdA